MGLLSGASLTARFFVHTEFPCNNRVMAALSCRLRFRKNQGQFASLASRSRGMIISTTRCCASRFACSRA